VGDSRLKAERGFGGVKIVVGLSGIALDGMTG
jgi:hypothetical protein